MSTKDVKWANNGLKLDFDANGWAIFPTGQILQNAYNCSDLRDLLLTIVGTGTVNVYGSCQELPPDFSAASIITNSYVPITLADYSLADVKYSGGLGATVAASTKIVELDTNILTWIAIKRGAQDTCDVLLTLTNAQ
jgi:hypothetical protein